MAFRCGEGTGEAQRVGGCLQGNPGEKSHPLEASRLVSAANGEGVTEGKAKENENNSSSLPATQAPKSGICVILLGEPTVADQVPAACWRWRPRVWSLGALGAAVTVRSPGAEPWDVRHVQTQSPVSPKPGVLVGDPT